jgi:hypothetical protein
VSTSDSDAGPDLPRVLKAAAAVIAPGTALTAVLYYFGYLHAFYFCNYFGVNSTTLGFTAEDYLMRNVDGLFVPLTVVAVLGLLVLWGHRLLGPYLAEASRARTPITLGALGAGVVLSFLGLLNVFGVVALGLAVAPICLTAGVLLLMLAVRGHRRERPAEWSRLAEWAAVFVIVSICAFWAAGDYAASVGVGRARSQAASLPRMPDVLLYSAADLGLAGPGLTETPCTAPNAAYRYRYAGLKLVLQSGDQYLLLPQRWAPGEGLAIVLPRTESVRLEYAAAGTGSAAWSTSC